MAQTTQTQRAEMDAAANRFEQVNGELQSMLNTLLRQLEGLQSQWQGHGGRSFDAVKHAWSADQADINRNLLETAEALRTAGQNYAISDEDAARTMNNTRGSLTLPLQ